MLNRLDTDRLRVLHHTKLLDSLPEAAFDRLTRLAASLLGVPVALVSLVDEDRQFFKSAYGLKEPWASRRETPLTHSFCLHTTHIGSSGDPLIVSDAREHPLLRDNLAIRELGAIAYAGIPLVVEGVAIGAFCAIDDRPRPWTEKDVGVLRDLAASVVSEIELRMAVRSATEQRALTSALLEDLGDGVLAIDTRRTFIVANAVARRWFEGAEAGKPLPPDWTAIHRSTMADGSLLAPEDGALARGLRGDPTDGLTFTLQGPTASETTWVEATGRSVHNDQGVVIAAVGVYRDITERLRETERNTKLQAELTARESEIAGERKYRELYEHAPDMYLTADLPSETIIDCNQTLCDCLGYEKSEILGKPYPSLYHPDFLELRDAARVAFQKMGGVFDVERKLRRKDGTWLDVSMNLRGLRDDNGNVTQAMAVWRDISKRKQTDRDRVFLLELSDTLRGSTVVSDVLAAVSLQLGKYLSVSRCVFAEIDRKSDRVIVHPCYEDGVPPLPTTMTLSLFGAETIATLSGGATVVLHDAMTDSRTASFVSTYQRAAVRAAISAPQMRDGVWAASLVVTSHAARVWDEREVTLVRLVGESVWLWVEHFRVLAKLREVEVAKAVQRSEQRFRTLVEGVKDYAIYMLDSNGNVQTWNAGAERLKGYDEAEIVGQSFEVFFSESDRERGHPREILAEARSGGRYEEEGWRVRKDGSRFWASIVITPLYGQDRSVVEGFAKVTRDVTERRKRDEDLKTKQAALAQSLREREVLLQEVHHRVKNNLQVISSLINMQARKMERGAARSALDECQTRVLTIALIHEKLYQAKDYAEVHFAEYVRSLADNVFQATGISPTDISLELDIDDVSLGVDRAIPCGLLINELITNSLKHAFKNGRCGVIRVALKALADTGGGSMIRLTVSDDGAGLPDNFDVHKVASMGLQLVVTLVQQLDASLVVMREGGASFAITFCGDR